MTNKMFSKRYKLGETIGKGNFGKVKIATKRNDILKSKYAVKIIPKRKCNDNVEREITILSTCDHPHIISCIEHFSEKYYYIVMDYIQGGDLFSVIEKGPLKDATAKRYFAQIVSAVEYFHGNLITHRDLKLDNILVDNDTIKIADFGLANFINIYTLHKTYCGSPEYTAPEIICKEKYNPIKSDIWSLGIILYTMVSACFPWSGDAREMIDQITNCGYIIPDSVSDSAADLISKILIYNPKKRLSIAQIKKHPWLREHSLDSYLPKRRAIRHIDLILVEKITSLGFDQCDLLMDLANGVTTQATSMYYLLAEKNSPEDNLPRPKSTKSLTPTFLRKNPKMRNIL